MGAPRQVKLACAGSGLSRPATASAACLLTPETSYASHVWRLTTIMYGVHGAISLYQLSSLRAHRRPTARAVAGVRSVRLI